MKKKTKKITQAISSILSFIVLIGIFALLLIHFVWKYIGGCPNER